MEAGLPETVRDAAYQGGAQVVAAWLDEGGGVDAGCAGQNGMTLLMAAAYGGQGAMVRMLLRSGDGVQSLLEPEKRSAMRVSTCTCTSDLIKKDSAPRPPSSPVLYFTPRRNSARS